MKTINYIVAFIFLFLIMSCGNKKKESENGIHIKANVSYILDNMFIPRDIAYRDSFFIIGDRGNNMIYSVFKQEPTALELFDTFGEIGQGPGEFIFPESMRLMSGKIAVFDRSLIRLSEISFPPLDTMNISSIKNKSFAGLNNVLRVDDSLFVGLTYLNTARFMVLNDGILYPSGLEYPDDGIMAPMRQKALVYQGNLLKHPSKDEFVYASLYGKIVEFYKLDRVENKMYSSVSKNLIFPQYTPVEDRSEIESNFTVNNVTGYIYACVSDEYVFLLYSGKTVKDSRKNFSNQIEVYNWNGDLVKVLILDEDLSAFCVDSKNKMIYGVTYSEETEKALILGYEVDFEKALI